MGRRSSALATAPQARVSSITILPPPPEDMGSVEQMLSALHKASASLDVKLARWHESIHQSLEDGDQEPWPEDLPLPEFNPLRPSVNVPDGASGTTPGNDASNEPAPRASGTRRRRRPRIAR